MGRGGCDRMVVGFIATFAINVVSSNPAQARCTSGTPVFFTIKLTATI